MHLTIARVLGDGPFAEVGEPTAAAAKGGLVAVGGDLGSLYWEGDGTADSSWSQHRFGVYGGERCLLLETTRWRVNSLAFHPSLPLLAVGTGSYDGGNYFDGELLLFDVETGEGVSLVEDEREVRRVWWTDARTLHALVAPPNDDDFTDSRDRGFTEVIVRDDWREPEPHRLGEHVDGRSVAIGAEVPALEVLREWTSPDWVPRGQVWAVAPVEDRVAVARDGVVIEMWEADGASWSVPHASHARQLLVDPGGATALVTMSGRYGDGPDHVYRVSLDDGRVIARLDEGWPVVLSGGRDGSVLLRHTNYREEHPAVLRDPRGEKVGSVALHGCDTINQPFAIRNAERPLVLVGEPDTPHRNKWVAAVGPDAGLDRLFPLEWDAELGRHLFGGPGVLIGDTLVHAGSVYSGHGLLPGNVFVVARDARTGEARWVHTADVPVTAVESDGERVHVAYNDGGLHVLGLAGGGVLHYEELTVHERPVVLLSLALDGPGRLLAGTVDGRVLVIRVES